MNTIHDIAAEFANALIPLKKAAGSASELRALMLELGWYVDQIPEPIFNLSVAISQLEDALATASATDATAADYESLQNALIELYEAIKDLENQTFDIALESAGLPDRFPQQIIDYLLLEYLRTARPKIHSILELLGIVAASLTEETELTRSVLSQRIAWDRIAQAFGSPSSVLETAFAWNTDEFASAVILQIVLDLGFAAKLPAYLEELDEDAAALILDSSTIDETTQGSVNIPVLYVEAHDGAVIAGGLRIARLPATDTALPGLALLPYLTGEIDAEFDLGNNLSLTIESSLDIGQGMAIKLRPGQSIGLLHGFADGDSSIATGTVIARLTHADDEGDAIVLIGSDNGSQLSYQALSVKAGLTLESPENAELFIELELEGGKLAIKGGEGDGFIQKIFPEDGIEANFDLAIGWSNTNGIYFRGSSALEINIPTHVELGPIVFDSVTLAITPSGSEIPIELGASITTELGPLTAVVDNIGLSADFSFPGSGGNLGPIDLDLGFKPPNGVGLSIDSQGFTGGGFLYLDVENGRYLGALELKFQNNLSLAAIGILDTQLPSGEDGFSLLISISAEFPAIQLGFGFTLNGVGGLLGLNRTMELDILRDRVKTGATDHILFPSDVVANASAIISDLSEIFPVYEGQFVFGPMAKLGWGTPTLITAEIGLLIEVTDPLQVAILGVLKAIFPDADAEIIVIQVAFLGTIDLEAGLLSFDASIYDSKLVSFTLSGDIAVRLAWGSEPNMLLTVGGFHPSYDPPPLALPELSRLTISLVSGNNPRITLEAYLAVTSNTVQVGSRAELYAEAWKVYVYGYISFDALFQFSPFYFIISASAMMEVGMGNKVLMSVSLLLNLEGPSPWKANGTATFKVLGVKVEVSFQKTFGQTKDTTLPDVPVLPKLVEALEQPDNWVAQLPARSSQWVTLRDSVGTDEVVAHPAGTLTLSQKIVPLEFTLDTFGNQRPSDANYFEIARVTSNTEELATSDVREYFAPAQYEEMSDSEKLSRPSFEQMKSGVEIGSGTELAAGGMVRRSVEYESIYIDTNYLRIVAGKLGQLWGSFRSLARGGSVAKVAYSYERTRKSTLAPEQIEVAHEGFTVVSAVDLTVYDNGATLGSEAEARDYMDRLIAANPKLATEIEVVANYEVNAA